ncbi:MAG: glycosyltransferase family 2 protein [Gammaproteobacteria bacterium]|nr:glycosyltransferase family 2 protein [Gammaproteobacteria bacterium]
MILERIPILLRALLFLCRCDARFGNGALKRLDGEKVAFEAGLWRPAAGWLIARITTTRDCARAPSLQLLAGRDQPSGDGRLLSLVSVSSREFQGVGFSGSEVRRIRAVLGECEDDTCIDALELYNVPGAFVRHFGFQALSAHHLDLRGTPVSRIRRAFLQHERSSGEPLDEFLDKHIQSLFEPTEGVDYATWIARVENDGEAGGVITAGAEADAGAGAGYAPLISLLLPVVETDDAFLRHCLDSVSGQAYPNWELCVVDAAPSSSSTGKILGEYAARDRRIRISGRHGDDPIPGALGAALSMARGEYVAVLGPADTLSPAALGVVVEAIGQEPRARILYGDEDTIDAAGERSAPHFKSGWNPDLLYGQNYVSRLVAYELALVQAVGGFRERFEGQQEHDLILRAGSRVDEGLIRHIPRVLYHRRSLDEGGKARGDSEGGAWDMGLRAVQSFFDEHRSGVRVERGAVPLTYRPRWPVPNPPPLVSVVVPTRDNVGLLEPCISSVLEKTLYPNYEVLIVDNESGDAATVNYLARASADPRVRVLEYPGRFNFSAINNYAVAEAAGEILCLLNDDTEVIDAGWLDELVSHACREEIGCVGAKLLYPNGRIQHAGVICGIGGIAGHSHRYFPETDGGYFSRLLLIQNLSAVTAACLAVRRDVWQSAGGMNEADLPVAFNDVDFCLRVRQAGLRNLWTPYALLRHHESASRGSDIAPRDKKRYFQEIDYMRSRWGNYLHRDPYYSPHLSLKREDFSLSVSRRYRAAMVRRKLQP